MNRKITGTPGFLKLSIQGQIIAIAIENGHFTAKAISVMTGISAKKVGNALFNLAMRGAVRKVAWGEYRLRPEFFRTALEIARAAAIEFRAS